MTDITKLIDVYKEVANEANDRNPNNSNLEKLLKDQIRQLALNGGPNGQPLYEGIKLAGAAANYECPPGWIHCAGGCVPEEVGCEGGAA